MEDSVRNETEWDTMQKQRMGGFKPQASQMNPNEWKPEPTRAHIFGAYPLVLRRHSMVVVCSREIRCAVYMASYRWHEHPNKQVFMRRTFPELRNEKFRGERTIQEVR